MRELMRNRKFTYVLALCAVFLSLSTVLPARAQKKDYLSAREAAEVRDADTPSDRIKLFISFAGDRIRKIQYEFEHPSDNTHPADRINALINNFASCVDDAADLIDDGADKQQEIRPAIKEMQARAPEFLMYLKSLQDQGAKMDDYKENLNDAVESVNDALKTAADAMDILAPPPVRRKPPDARH
jgi:hypothetical protein